MDETEDVYDQWFKAEQELFLEDIKNEEAPVCGNCGSNETYGDKCALSYRCSDCSALQIWETELTEEEIPANMEIDADDDRFEMKWVMDLPCACN